MKRWMVASILLAAVLAMGVSCARNEKKMNHVQIGNRAMQIIDSLI
jgi:hypothetical protein